MKDQDPKNTDAFEIIPLRNPNKLTAEEKINVVNFNKHIVPTFFDIKKEQSHFKVMFDQD